MLNPEVPVIARAPVCQDVDPYHYSASLITTPHYEKKGEIAHCAARKESKHPPEINADQSGLLKAERYACEEANSSEYESEWIPERLYGAV